MKNAMILLGLWVGIILVAYAIVFVGEEGPTPAQQALLERLAERTIVDSEGRFQFEAPPGWRVSREEYGVHLVDPMEEIEVWIAIVDDMAAPRAIRIACEWVEPCAGGDLESFEELTPPAFAEREVRLTYATGDEDALSYGIGLVRVGETVVLLVRGDAAACEARAGDLARIEETLTAPALVPSPGAP
jgi:hypothetical protein